MTEELTNSPDKDKKQKPEKPKEEPSTPQHVPEDSHYIGEGKEGPKETRKKN